MGSEILLAMVSPRYPGKCWLFNSFVSRLCYAQSSISSRSGRIHEMRGQSQIRQGNLGQSKSYEKMVDESLTSDGMSSCRIVETACEIHFI